MQPGSQSIKSTKLFIENIWLLSALRALRKSKLSFSDISTQAQLKYTLTHRAPAPRPLQHQNLETESVKKKTKIIFWERTETHTRTHTHRNTHRDTLNTMSFSQLLSTCRLTYNHSVIRHRKDNT